MIPISKAAKLLGVSIQTLRRWDKAGTLRPAYVSPGGHRYYAASALEQYTRNLWVQAHAWAASTSPLPLTPDLYCQTSSIFQARLSSFETGLQRIPDLKAGERFSLVVSMVGEIGDNAYAHNLGNWPDIPGVFFAADLNRRQVVVADRGLGVLITLRRVKPELRDDAEALRVAFTETISARAPERRGNGLKYVRRLIATGSFHLRFQSGQDELFLHAGSDALDIHPAGTPIRGTIAFLTF
ncbi:MAG: MerR family DNA-binding transcriptional regulator [Candidatus Kerfeldbacteria bacterium]|nr:MerR family DNA-binding transcriptional regulator [Candidatus Kerfeldbacteria bacterium]